MITKTTDLHLPELDWEYFSKSYDGPAKNSAGLNVLLGFCELSPRVTRSDEVAYICATVLHECGLPMLPKKEWVDAPWNKGKTLWYAKGYDYPGDPAKGGKKHPNTGFLYIGMGYVQLTWYCNYLYQSKKLGIDLVNNPDQALIPSVSFKVLENFIFDGDGIGGKYKAHDFFRDNTSDFLNARHLINGIDQQGLIAAYAEEFHASIRFKEAA